MGAVKFPKVQRAILKELTNGPATTYDLITTLSYNKFTIMTAIRLLRQRNLVSVKKHTKMMEIPVKENLISLV